jgi:hypothetical protein
LLTILVAIAFGGAGYLYGINAGKTITAVTATATATVTSSKTITTSATVTATTQSSNSPELPVIVFKPDTFTQAEKDELKQKVIDPFVYYEQETRDNRLVTVVANKYSESEKISTGYYYAIEEFAKDGGWGGWLLGKDGKIDYWRPECMDKCSISDAFRAKFPNNIPRE